MASERLSDRLRLFNGEAKRFKRLSEQFFIEDIWIYSAVVIASLGADLAHNLCFYLGLYPDFRPYNIGAGQLTLAGAFLILIVRKVSQWQYAKKESDACGLS